MRETMETLEGLLSQHRRSLMEYMEVWSKQQESILSKYASAATNGKQEEVLQSTEELALSAHRPELSSERPAASERAGAAGSEDAVVGTDAEDVQMPARFSSRSSLDTDGVPFGKMSTEGIRATLPCSSLEQKENSLVRLKTGSGPVRRCLDSYHFGFAISFVILSNVVFMAIAADHRLEAVSEGRNIDDSYIMAGEVAFTCIYVIELLLKFVCYGKEFFFGSEWHWNMFDMIIVLSALCDLLAVASQGAMAESDSLVVGDITEGGTGAKFPPSRVAVMLGTDVEPESLPLHGTGSVQAIAETTFFRDPRTLLIVSTDNEAGRDHRQQPVCQAEALEDLGGRLGGFLRSGASSSGPSMWPLHDKTTALAVQAMSLSASTAEQRHDSFLQKALVWLRISVPNGGSAFLHLVRDQYGENIAYSCAWNRVWVQKLWLLGAMALFATFFGASPAAGEWKTEAHRAAWRVLSYAMLVWGAWVLHSTWRKDNHIEPQPDESQDRLPMENPHYHADTPGEACRRCFLIAVFALPLFLLFTGVVTFILFCVIQFNAWLAFDWGDCIQLGCRDPATKHGIIGTIAEIGSDVCLAIIFEGILALTKVFGNFLATLSNFKLQSDYEARATICTFIIEGVGKVVPFMILALMFAPQWEQPMDGDITETDCSDLFLFKLIGKSAFPCLARRVPLVRRREVFYMMLKGPFVVAPFLAILIKVVIPIIAQKLDRCARSTYCCCKICDVVFDGVARLLALIFGYDGDSVGCFNYIIKGYPFEPPIVKSGGAAGANEHAKIADTASEADVFDDALRQGIRKPFEPMGEMLEINLNFLFVLFFAPVRPAGVVPTILARLLETQTDVSKMLFARRRVFPSSATIMHKIQRRFIGGGLLFAICWSFCLDFLTYNDDLWESSLATVVNGFHMF